MTEYQNLTVGDICDVGDGAHAKVARQQSGVLYLTSKNIGDGELVKLDEADYISEDDYQKLFPEGSAATRRPKPGDVLIGIIGTFGNAYLYRPGDHFGVSSSVALLRPKPDLVDGAFLQYLVRSELFRSTHAAFKSGSVQGYTNIPTIKRIPIKVPPLAQQRAIASVLTALDEKIRLNRDMNKTLEMTMKALYRHWFVDYGPVRAKIEGRKCSGISNDIAHLFPKELVDDRPSGWRLGTLGDIANSPSRPVQPSDVPPETPYIGLEHMPKRSISLAEWETAGKVESNKIRFERGEFLFGKLRPYFHKVGIAAVDGICSTDIVVVRPNSPNWAGFVLACLSSDEFVAHTDRGSTGTKMPRTSWKDMQRFEIALPPEELANQFSAIVVPMFETILANILESKSLSSIRDLILPKLLSGDLTATSFEQNGNGGDHDT